MTSPDNPLSVKLMNISLFRIVFKANLWKDCNLKPNKMTKGGSEHFLLRRRGGMDLDPPRAFAEPYHSQPVPLGFSHMCLC